MSLKRNRGDAASFSGSFSKKSCAAAWQGLQLGVVHLAARCYREALAVLEAAEAAGVQYRSFAGWSELTRTLYP